MNPAIRKIAGRVITYGLRALACGYGPLDVRVQSAVRSERELPVALATLTGHRDVPQAVASLLSFHTHVGRPREIVVADDGTLTADDRRTLLHIGRVRFYETSVHPDLPCAAGLERYVATHVLGRKITLLIELTTNPKGGPVLYIDTDVLFFRASDHLTSLLAAESSVPRYMSDSNQTSRDSRLDTAGMDAVNSGFLIFPGPISWDAALIHCCAALSDPEWFTEQTVVHFAMHANQAEPLPPDQYILRWDDRRFRRDVAGVGAVARHYVVPVRWRFWIRAYGGWRWAVLGGIRGAVRKATGSCTYP